MENLGSKTDLGTFGFGGGLHSMTSNQGSRCHTSSSDSLAALAAPGRVKMSGRFREFHPDLFWGKGQKNMFSSEKKTPTSSKATSNVSNIYPDVIHASWLHLSFALGTFPSHKKKNTKTAPPSPLRCQKDEILGCIDVPALKAKDGRPKKRWSFPGKSWKITANHPTGGHTKSAMNRGTYMFCLWISQASSNYEECLTQLFCRQLSTIEQQQIIVMDNNGVIMCNNV